MDSERKKGEHATLSSSLREFTEHLSDPVAFTQEVWSTQVPVPAIKTVPTWLLWAPSGTVTPVRGAASRTAIKASLTLTVHDSTSESRSCDTMPVLLDKYELFCMVVHNRTGQTTRRNT